MSTKAQRTENFDLSWMDRFFHWVDKLPFHYFWFYLFIYLFVVLSQHLAIWLEGVLPMGEFAPVILVQTVWFVFVSTFWQFMRRSGATALVNFRPALQLAQREYERVRDEFLYLPSRTGWGFTIVGIVLLPIGLPLFDEYYGPLFSSAYTKYSTLILSLIVVGLNLGAFYSAIRMLAHIDKLYKRVKQINLFNLTPLYSLSLFTSKVGMVFIIFVLLNLITPYVMGTSDPGIQNFYTLFKSIFALLIFIMPLLGIHRRLEEAKAQAVETNNDLIENGFAQMQSLVKAGKHEEVSKWRGSNSALLEYRQELNRISTWPLDTATLRSFVTALFVPLTVWSIQQLVNRVIN